MSSRVRILIVALCASLLPASATAAGATLDSPRPTVVCSAGVCVTHFKAHISGTQNTSWKLPYQRAGAADCYHVPYVSGEGNQQIRFAGSGPGMKSIYNRPRGFATEKPHSPRQDGNGVRMLRAYRTAPYWAAGGGFRRWRPGVFRRS